MISQFVSSETKLRQG